MPSLPRQQPFHEPVGLSPEGFTTSRRRILTLTVTVLVLAAGVIAALVLADPL